MKVNTKDNLAVEGFDVVEFFSGKATKGKSTISHQYKNVDYYFSSTQNREKSMYNPASYLPEYGGFCAIAMSEGKEVDANPKSFKIQDGKLYLFFREYWGIVDVKRQWNRNPDENWQLADINWRQINR